MSGAVVIAALSSLFLLALLAYARIERLFPWQQGDAGDVLPARSRATARGWFWFSFFLGVLFAVWSVLRAQPDYHDLFVISAYLPLDFAYLTLALTCAALLAMVVMQLRTRDREAIAEMQSSTKLSFLIPELHRAAPVRLPTGDLCRLFVQVMSDSGQIDAVAVFLFAKGEAGVLAAQQGLTKEEIQFLEESPEGIRQLRGISEPAFLHAPSRSDSGSNSPGYEVCPLLAGVERVGLIILKPADARTGVSARQLMIPPAACWLAERLHANQRERELGALRSGTEVLSDQLVHFQALLPRLLSALIGPDAITAFTECLVGQFGSREVYLLRWANGEIETVSALLSPEYSATMREAIRDAMQRDVSVLIHQEAEQADTRDSLAGALLWSNLVIPIGDGQNSLALLFRSANGRIELREQDHQLLPLLRSCARIAVSLRQSRTLEQLRRRMLERIIRLLRDADSIRPFQEEPDGLLRRLAPALPEKSRWLVWAGDDHLWRPVAGSHAMIPESLTLKSQPAIQWHQHEPLFFLSSGQAVRALERLGADASVAGEWLDVVRSGLFVILPMDQGCSVLALPLEQLGDAAEYERMIVLAQHLYAMGLRGQRVPSGKVQIPDAAQTLPPSRPSAEAELPIQAPVHEAAAVPGEENPAEPEVPDFGDSESSENPLTPLLERNRISGQLYMIGGRPREVILDAQGSLPGGSVDRFAPWLEQVLARFSMATAPDDHLVLELRSDKAGHLLLIHRVNRLRPAPLARPPQDRLRDPRAIPLTPATDAYRRLAIAMDAFLWIDQSAASPAAIGFFFPAPSRIPATPDRGRSVVAIDSSPIILDLIEAMGGAQGMSVQRYTTSRAAEEALAGLRADLAFIDQSLPDGSGLELAAKFRRQHPQMAIVLVCGWERSLNQNELRQAGISRVLRKPFRLEQLAEVVRELLGSPALPS